MSERKTPYQRLIESARKYASAVMYPTRKSMWIYPKARLGEGWKLSDLHERVAAAEQLGYEVRLRCTGEGLLVEYIEKRPDAPNEWWS